MLGRWTLALAAVPGFAACGRRLAPDPSQARARAERYDDAVSCEDTSDLFPAERVRRTANEYADRTPRPPEYCFNCQYWEAAPRDEVCGACALVPGPIHPLGWCKAWIYDWKGGGGGRGVG